MARLFSGSGQYITKTAAYDSLRPFSGAAWITTASAISEGNDDRIVWSIYETGARHSFVSLTGQTGSVGSMRFFWRRGGTDFDIRTSNTMNQAGVWQHVAWRCQDGNQDVILNGDIGNAGTATATPTTLGVSETGIGHMQTVNLWNGAIAWVSIWQGVFLDDDVITNLAAGAHPMAHRPDTQRLVLPLWGDHSPEIDLAPDRTNIASWTLTGPPTKQIGQPPIPLFSSSWAQRGRFPGVPPDFAFGSILRRFEHTPEPNVLLRR